MVVSPPRRSQLAAPLAIPTIARIASFGGMAWVAQMRRQLGFQHLFKGVGKQAREDALLAKEIVDTCHARQLLLNAFNRRQDRWSGFSTVNHGVTPFLFVRCGSIPQTSDWVE